MKKNAKKLVAAVLAFAVAFTFCGIALAKSELQVGDKAEIILGKQDVINNLKIVFGNWNLVERGGRYGRQSDVASRANAMCYYAVDLDDSFMNKLPSETPIEIRVEYFDEGSGHFGITYDAYGSNKSTETVTLQNTKEWKTQIFYLEDAYFDNSCDGYDFRLGMWTLDARWSSQNVVLGSVTVERVDYRNPIEFVPKQSVTGNIFSDSDEIILKHSARNKLSDAVDAKFKYDVYDSEGNFLESKESIVQIDGGDTLEQELKFTNPVTYGIYKVKIECDYSEKSNPEKTYSQSTGTEFSVSVKLDEDRRNSIAGANGYADSYPSTAAELMSRNGMKWIRRGIRWSWVELEKGKYTVPDEEDAYVTAAYEKGLDILYTVSAANVLYDNGETPHSDEAVQAFANFAAYMAQHYKGKVKYIEVWNEYNAQTFNKQMLGTDVYVKILKATYNAVKAVDPTIRIVGIDCSGFDFDCIRGVLENGGGDYMDIVSIHPYPFDKTKYDETETIQKFQTLKGIMEEFGIEDKPIFFTEAGMSSCTGGYTEREQANALIMFNAVMRAYDMCDAFMMYCFYDGTSPDEREHNWGLVRNVDYEEDGRGYIANGAKPSFLSYAAMNDLWGDAELKDYDDDDLYYGLHFYNDYKGKDVLLLIANRDRADAYKSYDLGCKSVDLYDDFGNKITTLYSESGIYTLTVSATPKYIIGSFEKCERVEQPGTVSADLIEYEVCAGEPAEFNISKASEAHMNVAVTADEGLSVKSDNLFDGNNAKIVINTPQSAPDGSSYKVNITVMDDLGSVYYIQEHKITIKPPVSLEINSEQAVKNSLTNWRARVTVKNEMKSTAISGNVRATYPESVAEISPTYRMDNIAPGETITYLFNLPERVTKPCIKFNANVALDDGYSIDKTSTLDFGTAIYTEKKPTIDGIVSAGEWQGSWIGADTADDFQKESDFLDEWGGPSDVSFSGTMMWDEDNFYFMAIVTDDINYASYFPVHPKELWKADSVQFAIDYRVNPTSGKSRFTEIGLGDVPGMGGVAWRYKSAVDSGLTEGEQVAGSQVAVKRYSDYTVYECLVPWSGIFGEGYKIDTSRTYRFSCLANDSDGISRRGWIQYTSGIGGSKNVDLFGNLTFVK